MKVKVTKEFSWAPDGNHVRLVRAGEVLEGRGAEVAMQLKCGELAKVEPAKTPNAASSKGR